jgi:murein DD-endopeptidase MepM/ murein hydrolase activator NlpD
MALVGLAVACGDAATEGEQSTSDAGAGSGGAAGEAGTGGASGNGGWASGAPSDDAGPDAAENDAGADAANDAPATDPCESASDGSHCGGPLGADKDALYVCADGATSSQKNCANGCFQAAAEDVCASKCCIKKPPGYTVPAGVWNACPFKSSVSSREHMAIDYAGPKGSPIPASMDGTIFYIRNKGDPNCYNNGCTNACLATGNTIVLKAACGDPLKPANDLFLRYHHIADVAAGIKQGTKVARGTTIAKVGDSGCADGAHIHFQVASHPKGKYSQGELPNFYDCAFVKDPTTRLCSTLDP